MQIKAWIQLIRPSNVLTAISDVLAGVALACLLYQVDLPDYSILVCISLSSMLLYTGGIVFNDVFDAKLDAIERPERPIPSAKIGGKAAAIFASTAFGLGCILAWVVNPTTFLISLSIVLMCLLYNGKAKHHYVLGPLVMGTCRGLNLLLGFSIIPDALSYWYIAIVPIVYIASVTNISRGEVYGNNRTAMLVSVFLYSLVVLALVYCAFFSQHFFAFPFIFIFVFMIFWPLFKALKSQKTNDIRTAVKSGVLALILMNASWIAISGFSLLAICVCSILPISIFLAKKYAVT